MFLCLHRIMRISQGVDSLLFAKGTFVALDETES